MSEYIEDMEFIFFHEEIEKDDPETNPGHLQSYRKTAVNHTAELTNPHADQSNQRVVPHQEETNPKEAIE